MWHNIRLELRCALVLVSAAILWYDSDFILLGPFACSLAMKVGGAAGITNARVMSTTGSPNVH
eukprot:2551686-Prorocentrum_lima.AAC.1